jgi:hypothetical protein
MSTLTHGVGYIAAVRHNGQITSTVPLRDMPETITYDIEVFARRSSWPRMLNITPARRATRQSDIEAARVGDLAHFIYFEQNQDLRVFITEEILFEDPCEEGAP